jgi:hypothetical protein
VYVQATNGAAWLKYQCTAGEVVRAFALDVSVESGVIFAVSDFFVGPSRVGAQGYGIFPASFRDHATVSAGTNVAYDLTQYSPLAVVADNPGGTLPGLNSSGVTLELGALWDPTLPAAAPGSTGTLCAPDIVTPLSFTGAFVDANAVITSQKLLNGVLTLTFKEGVLETAPSLYGPWTSTGNSTGTYTDSIGSSGAKFYRVHHF